MSTQVAVTARPVRVRGRFQAPASRPEASAPRAHPARRVAAGRTGSASSCLAPERQLQVAPVSRVLKLKVAAVASLALLGVGVSSASFTSWSQPDPAIDVVAGDPGWAHVTGN